MFKLVETLEENSFWYSEKSWEKQPAKCGEIALFFEWTELDNLYVLVITNDGQLAWHAKGNLGWAL